MSGVLKFLTDISTLQHHCITFQRPPFHVCMIAKLEFSLENRIQLLAPTGVRCDFSPAIVATNIFG
jgi:hypothetical protein